MNSLKNVIRKIPMLGWVARWFYNLLRLNNTKHRLHVLESRFNNLSKDYQIQNNINKMQQDEINNLKIKIHKFDEEFIKQEKEIYDLVRRHISSQLIYFNQKIDNFINTSDTNKLTHTKNKIKQSFIDEFYVHFENKFRGSRDDVLDSCTDYLKYLPKINENQYNNKTFKSLDIGCGRAEWVELMQKEGYDAYGIDMNPNIVEVGELHNIKNLKVTDAFEFFKSTPNDTYDLVTAFHIIEHIPFEKLIEFLLEIKRISKQGATILLETPNPKNPQVSGYYFYLDLTHLNPLPHQSIEFLLQYIGFEDVQTKFLHPIPQMSPVEVAAQDYLIITKNNKSIDNLVNYLPKKSSIKRTIFVDKSALRIHDGNSGIQRVVKKQIHHLSKYFSDEFNIEPVYLKQYKNNNIEYYYDTLDAPVYLKRNDILYIPDLSYNSINKASELGLYDYYKSLGIKIIFLVHDILPITHEKFFKHQNAKNIHHKYITNVANNADLIISTTNVGKEEIEKYLSSNNINIPKIIPIHLGSDVKKINTLANDENKLNNKTNFLMVGTIEPRKAHAQVLEAFEILWDKGYDIYLTIIGKKGWLVEETINKITNHKQLNKKLFYIEKASDEELLKHYSQATAVIVASYAEGFGLPLVEAMYYQKDIIARNIPVFKEIANDYPYYFKDTKVPEDIVSVVVDYINTNKKQDLNKYNALTWKKHTIKLINEITKV